MAWICKDEYSQSMKPRTLRIKWMGEVETLHSADPQYKTGVWFSEWEVHRVELLCKRRSESASDCWEKGRYIDSWRRTSTMTLVVKTM